MAVGRCGPRGLSAVQTVDATVVDAVTVLVRQVPAVNVTDPMSTLVSARRTIVSTAQHAYTVCYWLQHLNCLYYQVAKCVALGGAYDWADTSVRIVRARATAQLYM